MMCHPCEYNKSKGVVDYVLYGAAKFVIMFFLAALFAFNCMVDITHAVWDVLKYNLRADLEDLYAKEEDMD